MKEKKFKALNNKCAQPTDVSIKWIDYNVHYRSVLLFIPYQHLL